MSFIKSKDGISIFAGDLAALIETLDLRQVTLVGHAMGCGVITRYLNEYGEKRVSGAVFLATTTPYMMKAADNPGGVDKSVFDQMIEAMEKDRPAFVSGLSQGFFAGNKEQIPVSTPMQTWAFSLVMQMAPQAGAPAQCKAIGVSRVYCRVLYMGGGTRQ